MPRGIALDSRNVRAFIDRYALIRCVIIGATSGRPLLIHCTDKIKALRLPLRKRGFLTVMRADRSIICKMRPFFGGRPLCIVKEHGLQLLRIYSTIHLTTSLLRYGYLADAGKRALHAQNRLPHRILIVKRLSRHKRSDPVVWS